MYSTMMRSWSCMYTYVQLCTYSIRQMLVNTVSVKAHVPNDIWVRVPTQVASEAVGLTCTVSKSFIGFIMNWILLWGSEIVIHEHIFHWKSNTTVPRKSLIYWTGNNLWLSGPVFSGAKPSTVICAYYNKFSVFCVTFPYRVCRYTCHAFSSALLFRILRFLSIMVFELHKNTDKSVELEAMKEGASWFQFPG